MCRIFILFFENVFFCQLLFVASYKSVCFREVSRGEFVKDISNNICPWDVAGATTLWAVCSILRWLYFGGLSHLSLHILFQMLIFILFPLLFFLLIYFPLRLLRQFGLFWFFCLNSVLLWLPFHFAFKRYWLLLQFLVVSAWAVIE